MKQTQLKHLNKEEPTSKQRESSLSVMLVGGLSPGFRQELNKNSLEEMLTVMLTASMATLRPSCLFLHV